MKELKYYSCDPEDLDLLCVFSRYINDRMKGYVREFYIHYLQRGLVCGTSKEVIESKPDLVDYAADVEMRVFIMEKIGKLSKMEKRIFVCCWERGMDTKETAAFLGVTETWVRELKRSIAKKFELGGYA